METYIDRNYAVTSNTICSYLGDEEQVSVPDKIALIQVKTIGKGAFEHSNHLESVTIAKGIERIGEYAFSSCGRLSEVIFEGTPKEIGEHAFWFCTGLSKLNFPNFSMPRDQFMVMKNVDAQLEDGWRVATSIPMSQLPKGLIRQADSLSQVSGSVDGLRAARRIPGEIEDLFMLCPISAEEEEVYKIPSMSKGGTMESAAFMQHIPNIHLEQVDEACEKANDELIRSEKTVYKERVAVFFYDENSVHEDGDLVYFHAFIRVGHFFWQSGKAVTVDGKEYYIYRRHHARSAPDMPYLRQDIAVYDQRGPLEDMEEAKRVYAKYRLLSFF